MPTADDAIVEKVRRATERLGVVTSDNELAGRCRSAALHGVDVLPAERLFADAKPPKKRDVYKRQVRRFSCQVCSICINAHCRLQNAKC